MEPDSRRPAVIFRPKGTLLWEDWPSELHVFSVLVSAYSGQAIRLWLSEHVREGLHTRFLSRVSIVGIRDDREAMMFRLTFS